MKNNEEYGYITVSEAAEMTGKTKKQINKICENERVRTKRLLINEDDIIQYVLSHPKNSLNTVWDEITSNKYECFYPIYGLDNRYFVSNLCTIINTTKGQMLTPQPHYGKNKKKTGYYQVTFMLHGKSIAIKLHQIVGMTQCDNALFKSIVHHIKPVNPDNMKVSDNYASNLLYVWDEQHKQLHNLLDNGKNEEYKKLVKEIKKENRQETYKILSPDYQSDENNKVFFYLTANGYKEFKKSGNIINSEIVCEYHEREKLYV